MDDDIKYWLALSRIPTLGPVKQRILLAKFSRPEEIFLQSNRSLERFGLNEQVVNYILKPDWDYIDNILSWADSNQHHVVTCIEEYYPSLLNQIYDAPVVLYVKGDPEILQLPQIAIVGSRNPSQSGKQTARKFSAELSMRGVTINSGLALGIDAMAHIGALDKNGTTLAVLAHGLDTVYPKRHTKLAEKIIGKGALVSEFPPGINPLASNFPMRNRIISGMCRGVLVVEAAQKSGSLITARLAMEQNREVFAVPGSISNPLTKGCHTLIKEGAKLVECIQDIIEEINDIFINYASAEAEMATSRILDNSNTGKNQGIILEYMQAASPVSIDQLVEQTALTAEEVSSILLLMELKGLVSLEPGGLYSRLV